MADDDTRTTRIPSTRIPRTRILRLSLTLGASAALVIGSVACVVGPMASTLVTAACNGTLVVDASGTVSDAALPEVSGVVSSTAHPGVLWVHNDSGDSARMFAVSTAGSVLGTFSVTGATATDWEDIAIGPGPVAGTRYLYLGDIGDNALARASIAVYRVAEPVVDAVGPPLGAQSVAGAEKLTLVYPDGAHNAETLLVDTNGDIFVVTKQAGSGTIYKAPRGLAGGSTTTLSEVGTVALPGGALLTGGDIAPSGDAILLRTYGQVYIYGRTLSAAVESTLEGTRCDASLTAEPQGEAIAFSADAKGYVTMSEGVGRPINRYRAPA